MFFACLALRYFLWPFRHLHNSPVFHQPFTLGGLFGTCVHFLVFSPHSSLRDPHSVQCRIPSEQPGSAQGCCSPSQTPESNSVTVTGTGIFSSIGSTEAIPGKQTEEP